MKYTVGLVLAALFGAFTAKAQMPNPVKWEYEVKSIGEGIFELHFVASIEGDWNIYSQYMEEGGPVPTAFTYQDTSQITFVGTNEERGKKKQGHDALFDMEVIKYAHQVTFVQKIKAPKQGFPIKGAIEYMVCNDESCLPPTEVPFELSLK